MGHAETLYSKEYTKNSSSVDRKHCGQFADFVRHGWYFNDAQPSYRQDTCATPEEAYVHTEKALMMFAQALDKGVKQMEGIQESTDKIERNIQKQLNKLND